MHTILDSIMIMINIIITMIMIKMNMFIKRFTSKSLSVITTTTTKLEHNTKNRKAIKNI